MPCLSTAFLNFSLSPPLLPPLSPLLSLSESIARSSCVEGQESCGKKWHNKDFEFCYKIPTRCHAISHLPRKLLPGTRHVFQLHGNRYLPRNLKLWCSWVMQCSFFFLLLFIIFFLLYFFFVLLWSMRPFLSYILFLPMNPVKLNCDSSLFSSFLRQANKIANKLSFSVVKIWSYWIWHIWTDRSDRLLL